MHVILGEAKDLDSLVAVLPQNDSFFTFSESPDYASRKYGSWEKGITF